MPKRIGTRTVLLENKPTVIGHAAVVGNTEGEGPLGKEFDRIHQDDTVGKESFEQAESAMQREAILCALEKAGKSSADADFILSGDLLAQCIGSAFGVRDLGIPFLGLYGACSTMALALGLASVLVDSGAANLAVAATSSHFASAERQFRQPLEYGGQRPPTAQRTATAAGATVLTNQPQSNDTSVRPRIAAVTFGKIIDLGIKDANNMGAAMAPAAADTIVAFLKDTDTKPSDYDLILTGDLGTVGTALLAELLEKDYGINIRPVHNDCGLLIYDREKQDVHAGGSGCGCAASVLNAHIFKRMEQGELKKVLLTATGAMMSLTSSLQGESIPSVAHAVLITADNA